MASICLQSIKNDNYYISLTSEVRYGRNIYIVQVCPNYGDYCGYPIKKLTYTEERKAKASYRRYVKKYCK